MAKQRETQQELLEAGQRRIKVLAASKKNTSVPLILLSQDLITELEESQSKITALDVELQATKTTLAGNSIVEAISILAYKVGTRTRAATEFSSEG